MGDIHYPLTEPCTDHYKCCTEPCTQNSSRFPLCLIILQGVLSFRHDRWQLSCIRYQVIIHPGRHFTRRPHLLPVLISFQHLTFFRHDRSITTALDWAPQLAMHSALKKSVRMQMKTLTPGYIELVSHLRMCVRGRYPGRGPSNNS